MAELACVYDAVPVPRTPEDVISTPAQKRRKKKARARTPEKKRKPREPQARGKWLTASVTDDIPAVIAAAFDEAERRDPDHSREWAVLIDGNNTQIEAVTAEAASRGITITIVIDFIHVLEYLVEGRLVLLRQGRARRRGMGRRPGPQDPARERGRSRPGSAAAPPPTDTPRRAHRRRRVRPVPEEQERYLGYATALQKGWPIATGIIEGACRHIVKDRMDITGARWGLEGAEAILKLRAVIATGDYPDVLVMPTVPAGYLRAAMGCAGPAIGIISEIFEEGEQRVAGSIAAARDARGCHAGQGLLLQLQVGVNVRLG